MGRKQQETGRVKLVCHLGANATKMHWRGTPGARYGTLILNFRGEIQACIETVENTAKAWHTRLGVARLTHQLLWACHLEPRGVARQLTTPGTTFTMACHLVSKAWNASSKTSLGRAT
ncbi:hypothetical protein AHAS_Ahas14G0145700 [Arachis hypogaea]